MPLAKPPTPSLYDRLKAKYPDVKGTTLKQWIKFNRVDLKSLAILPKQESLEGIPILYQDRDLVVLNKPHNLLSVASDTDKHSLHHLLKVHFYPKKIGVIHRLDEGTSGLIVFTFSEAAYHGLKEQFKEHAIERIYTALVEGNFPATEGEWESYIYEDKTLKMRMTDDPKLGEKAITHYKKTGTWKQYSRVEFQLYTGKKNQIRVQSAAAGYPIAGDKKYGAKTNPLKRLALHAAVLGFTHPVTKKRLYLSAPAPF